MDLLVDDFLSRMAAHTHIQKKIVPSIGPRHQMFLENQNKSTNTAQFTSYVCVHDPRLPFLCGGRETCQKLPSKR